LLEHRFVCEIGGIKVRGIVDRVDEDSDGYVIIDYKTGNPKSQKAAEDSLQLSVYAIALGNGKPVKSLVFQNLADNSTVETARLPEDLHRTELKIIEVAAGITAGRFEAKPGRHCNYCAYRSICPEKEMTASVTVRESVESN
jgi:RecB family exonuclease